MTASTLKLGPFDLERVFRAVDKITERLNRAAAALDAAGVPVRPVNKVHEGRPHIVDMMKNDEIALVVNTVEERRSAIHDSYQIRREALTDRIPTYTTLAGARAAALGLAGMGEMVPYAMQALHERLRQQTVPGLTRR